MADGQSKTNTGDAQDRRMSGALPVTAMRLAAVPRHLAAGRSGWGGTYVELTVHPVAVLYSHRMEDTKPTALPALPPSRRVVYVT